MNRALLVIDVQREYFTGALPVTYPPGSLDNILRAMDSAVRAGVPVILIQHSPENPARRVFLRGSANWQLLPVVAQRPHEMVIHKGWPDSFTETDLEKQLRTRGVDTVTICGYMTHMCCDTTARMAVHRGYKVEFLSDATGTLELTNAGGRVSAEELHRAILAVQAARFSRVMTTAHWMDAITPPGGGES